MSFDRKLNRSPGFQIRIQIKTIYYINKQNYIDEPVSNNTKIHTLTRTHRVLQFALRNCMPFRTMKPLKMTSAVIHIVMVDLAKNSTLYIYSSSIFLTSVPALIFFPQSLARSSPFHAFCSFIRFFSVFTLSYPRPRLSKHQPLAIPRSDLATRFSISNSCRVWIFQLICVCIVI